MCRSTAHRDRIKVSTIAHRLKSTSCSDQSRPHPSGCTLFFPSRGPDIGTHHIRQEVEALMELIDKPGIINVYDFSIEGEDKPFFVMDYHKGAKSLDKVIFSESNPFHGNALASLDVFEQIVQAIQVCSENSRPIFHRDINPKNILMLRDGSIRLIDFGVCQFENGEVITLTGEAVGARNYASRESEDGGEIGAYTDLYSAAKVLWSAVTSRPAFPREERVFGDLSMQEMFPHVVDTWHLSHIFEKTIRMNISDRLPSASGVLALVAEIRRIIEIGFPPLELVWKHCPSCGWSGTLTNYRDTFQIFGTPDNRKPSAGICSLCGFIFHRDDGLARTIVEAKKGLS